VIIVPLTVLHSGNKKSSRHSEDGSITVNQYYGSTRRRTRLQEYDVVLSTYGIIESEYERSREEDFLNIDGSELFR